MKEEKDFKKFNDKMKELNDRMNEKVKNLIFLFPIITFKSFSFLNEFDFNSEILLKFFSIFYQINENQIEKLINNFKLKKFEDNSIQISKNIYFEISFIFNLLQQNEVIIIRY